LIIDIAGTQIAERSPMNDFLDLKEIKHFFSDPPRFGRALPRKYVNAGNTAVLRQTQFRVGGWTLERRQIVIKKSTIAPHEMLQ